MRNAITKSSADCVRFNDLFNSFVSEGDPLRIAYPTLPSSPITKSDLSLMFGKILAQT